MYKDNRPRKTLVRKHTGTLEVRVTRAGCTRYHPKIKINGVQYTNTFNDKDEAITWLQNLKHFNGITTLAPTPCYTER